MEMPLRSASLLFFIDLSALSMDFATEDFAATALAAGFIGLSSTFGAGRTTPAVAARSLVVDFATGAAGFADGFARPADLVVPFLTENLMEEFPTALEGFAVGFAPLLWAEGFLVD